MNYQIIKDEKLLREFIDWLPELQPEEKYYCCLFARSKYTKLEDGTNGLPHIKSDKAQLKRFVSDKERMYHKIKQLEVELGAYQHSGRDVPQEALAVYITVNPRHMYRATVNTMVKLAQSIRDQNILMNPHQEALSEIQKTKSRTCWVDFDLDYKPDTGQEEFEVELQHFVYTHVGKSAQVKFLKTRGGFHILINPDSVEQEFKKSWYQRISKLPNVDQTGDQMIPFVGCTQGNYIPHFIN